VSSPSYQMTQPVGSSGGFKTQAEYDSAWANLANLNKKLYGSDGPQGNGNNTAQPGQPPTITPKPAGDFSAYRPGQAQSQQSPYASATPYGQNQGFQMYGQAAVPLPTFQFRGTDFAGNQYDNPAAFTAQQGATANALNAQRAQQINNQQLGRLDPFAAYQQGQRDIQGGFVNPFAQAPSPSPGIQFTPPPVNQGGGQFADIFQQFGVQAPPGLMDALLGRLQGQSVPPQVTPPQRSVAMVQRDRDGNGVIDHLPGGYGTPPDQRGGIRSAAFYDQDGDGVDDRDQDGPGMPGYRHPGDTSRPPQTPNRLPGYGNRPRQDAQAPDRPPLEMYPRPGSPSSPPARPLPAMPMPTGPGLQRPPVGSRQGETPMFFWQNGQLTENSDFKPTHLISPEQRAASAERRQMIKDTPRAANRPRMP